VDFETWMKRRAQANEAANRKFQEARARNFKVLDAPSDNSTAIAGSVAKDVTTNADRIDPSLVLGVIPKLMNSQVVLLMKGEVWTSQKALSGYMGFHHLLLALCRRYPNLQQAVDERIQRFLSSEEERVKAKVPNLGEFICLLSVSDRYDWSSIAAALLGEVFDRNVLWLLKRHPHLGALTDTGVSQERLRCTFQSSLVSMRLIMFNVWFLNNVAKVPHLHFDRGSDVCCHASCALRRYERTKGLPLRSTIEALHQAVKSIFEVASWQGYFNAVGIEHIEPAALCQWLRQSVLASLRKGYHREWQFRKHNQAAPQDSTGAQDCDLAEQLADAWD
jgi:hypothetical protein